MDRKLLLTILETSDITVNYAAVAAKISTEDQPSALTTFHRNGADDESTPKAKGKTTPRKRQAVTIGNGSPMKMMKHSSAAEMPSVIQYLANGALTLHGLMILLKLPEQRPPPFIDHPGGLSMHVIGSSSSTLFQKKWVTIKSHGTSSDNMGPVTAWYLLDRDGDAIGSDNRYTQQRERTSGSQEWRLLTDLDIRLDKSSIPQQRLQKLNGNGESLVFTSFKRSTVQQLTNTVRGLDVTMKEEDDYIDGSDVEDTGDFMEVPNGDKKKRKSAAGEIDQLVLLCVDYVCTKQGVPIPWDLVGKEINDTLTGEAIKQHLVKLKKARELHGQQVPPKIVGNERRKPVIDRALATPVKGRNAEKRSEKPTSELPMRNLIYIPSKKVASSLTGGKKSLNVGSTEKPSVDDPTSMKSTKDDSRAPRATEPKSTGRGSKRGRSSKKSIKQEDADSDFGSPSKKLKVIRQKAASQSSGGIMLREFPRKNYTEPSLEDDDVFTSKRENPKTNVLENLDDTGTSSHTNTPVPTSTSTSTTTSASAIPDYADAREVPDGAMTHWAVTSARPLPELQHPRGTLAMPSPHTAINNLNDWDQGYGNESYQRLFDGNYLWTQGRGGNHLGQDSYGGSATAPRILYNEANSTAGFANGLFNTLSGSGHTSPSFFHGTGSATPTSSNFVSFSGYRSPPSSDTSGSNQLSNSNGLVDPETGEILIGNGTGRGSTIVTPTTVMFDHHTTDRHIDGLPQAYNAAGDSSITFGITHTNEQANIAAYFNRNTQSLSGYMTQGMGNLILDSGPLNQVQSFDSSRGSRNNDNSQVSTFNHSSYVSDAYNASAYEQQHDSDDVFSSPQIDIYGDIE
nr:hypothetical protein CFP56_34986 [Quercus suber]